MSKKHFEAVAALIKSTIENNRNNHEAQVDTLIDGLVELYQKENPRFDATRFLNACGFKSIREIV